MPQTRASRGPCRSSKLASTSTRALWTSVAVFAGCVFLLGSGSAWAQNEPAPNPERLWDAFPLDPPTTTPAPGPEPQPPVTEPVEPTPAPAVPPSEEDGNTGWSLLVLGGLAGAAVLVLGGWLVLRARPRRVAPSHLRTTDDLVGRAYALAAECDMLLASQRDKGVDSVSEIADHDSPAAQATPSASGSSSYAEIGDRVAGVLSAAEAAAEQIREDARRDAEELLRAANGEAEQVRQEAMAYDSDTRGAVDTFATERRREAEQQVQKQLAEAETQARATREAAEQMARQIEEDGRLRGEVLREESRGVEERLKKALVGLRRMTAQLEELVGAPTTAQTDGESLADALKPYGNREEELQPVADER